ncbi:MAG: hypothetical protein FWE50_02745 [Alphaproteobacteria bacterium]|nr:hypothetical protein [Alphaproteobacteria bacterium]
MSIFKRQKKHPLIEGIESFVQLKRDNIEELRKDDAYFMMASPVDYINSPRHSERQIAIIRELEEVGQIVEKLQSTELKLMEFESKKQQFLAGAGTKMLES